MERPILVLSPSGAGGVFRTYPVGKAPPSGVMSAQSLLGLLGCGELASRQAGEVHWSGSLAELDEPAGGLFDEDPRTWGTRGWAALDAALAEVLAGIPSVVIRPHARHVVSDIPGCARVLRAWGAKGLRLLGDPVSMLTPTLLAGSTGLDVLARGYEALAAPPMSPDESEGCVRANGGLWGVVVANVVLDERMGVRACPLTEGLLDAAMIARLAAAHVPRGVPLVLIEGDEADQLRLLAKAGVTH